MVTREQVTADILAELVDQALAVIAARQVRFRGRTQPAGPALPGVVSAEVVSARAVSAGAVSAGAASE
jgi:hypothetical protein